MSECMRPTFQDSVIFEMESTDEEAAAAQKVNLQTQFRYILLIRLHFKLLFILFVTRLNAS